MVKFKVADKIDVEKVNLFHVVVWKDKRYIRAGNTDKKTCWLVDENGRVVDTPWYEKVEDLGLFVGVENVQ